VWSHPKREDIMSTVLVGAVDVQPNHIRFRVGPPDETESKRYILFGMEVDAVIEREWWLNFDSPWKAEFSIGGISSHPEVVALLRIATYSKAVRVGARLLRYLEVTYPNRELDVDSVKAYVFSKGFCDTVGVEETRPG
jgi:hypothetical protein